MKIGIDKYISYSCDPMQSIRPRYHLVPVERTHVRAEPTKSERTLVILPRPRQSEQTSTPLYNIHLDKMVNPPVKLQTSSAPPVLGDCICVFCNFRFVPKKSKPAEWISESFMGYDYCPICCSQGGIIRAYNIDLTKLDQIRVAVIDIIETQHRKSQPYARSPKKINPIWDAMVTST